MPTTVHIPPRVLAALDRRARALRISRNRLIVQAVERELSPDRSTWPEEFVASLRAVDPDQAARVDDLLDAVKASRTSKPPIAL
jgi:hypothetical protein